MNTLTVTIVQYDIVWETKEANFRIIEGLLQQAEAADIIVLPEMFSSGFSMNISAMAENMDGQTVNWMKQLARMKNAAVCGSLIIEENMKFFNRLLFVKPDGEIQKYDKRHLFSMGNENKHFSSGNERLIIDYKGFRILPLVCYDLRFPVWSRNRNDFDLMIYVANWPAPRRKVWEILLCARAIENQSYVLGVNRVGEDANGIKYSGDSFAIDPKGKITKRLDCNAEGLITEKLSLESLHKFRRNFPVLDDVDLFSM